MKEEKDCCEKCSSFYVEFFDATYWCKKTKEQIEKDFWCPMFKPPLSEEEHKVLQEKIKNTLISELLS